MPATKPPMCAHQATPPACALASLNASAPEKNCWRNQNPRKKKAGTETSWMKMPIGNSITTRARG